MSARVLFAAGLLTLGACAFEPDLSRFEPCTEAGECRPGFLCLSEAQRCVPECGEDCPPPRDAGSDAGADAGVDAGVDAGADAGEVDAGMDAGFDAGVDAGPELALAAMTLPAAIETKPYSVGFVPTGGQPGYSFSMDGGVPGFTLSFSGTLSTPAAPTPGTFPFSISVQDQAPNVVTTPFSLEVRPFLRVASNVLVEGRQGQVYLHELSATGGQPPYRWVVDGGMPPGGLSLSDAGVLQGTPSSSGTPVMFGVTVTDSAMPPQSASRQLTVQVKLLAVILEIANAGAPDGRVGTGYNLPLKAYGGTPPYTWSIQTGSASLPPGLTLMNAGANWSLSGTPTDAGTFPFTLRVVDSLLAGQNQPLSIVVY